MTDIKPRIIKYFLLSHPSFPILQLNRGSNLVPPTSLEADTPSTFDRREEIWTNRMWQVTSKRRQRRRPNQCTIIDNFKILYLSHDTVMHGEICSLHWTHPLLRSSHCAGPDLDLHFVKGTAWILSLEYTFLMIVGETGTNAPRQKDEHSNSTQDDPPHPGTEPCSEATVLTTTPPCIVLIVLPV